MPVSPKDRTILRDLAQRVAAIAAQPIQKERARLWLDHNGLRPARPVVLAQPEGAWTELVPDATLQCQDELLRGWEQQLRCSLFRGLSMPDDQPVTGTVYVQWVKDVSDWGVPVEYTHGEDRGSYRWDAPIKSEADFVRLRQRTIRLDRAASQRHLEAAKELLGDLVPVKMAGSFWWSAGLTWALISLRGLQQIMLDLYDNPGLLHRLMAFLRDGVLRGMEQVEQMGVLTENNTAELYCSDSLRRSPPDGPVTISDLWGDTNSQEFQEVSPAMWEEFLLSYQKPILERFALVSYGCCENLTRKIDGVLTIPNLRIFVCSAWTHLAQVVEKVGGRYAIMWRQKATDVVFAEDVRPIRRHLEEGMKLSQGCCRQVVLRELQTLNGRLTRLHEWAQAAKEMAAKYN